MQARYYDPYAGRFLAIDPVAAEAGSFNRYWYANNNPYTNIDPDGREGCAASRIGAVCDRLGMSSATSAAAREGIGRIAKDGTKLVVATVAPMGDCIANGCTAGEAAYEAATSIPVTKVLKGASTATAVVVALLSRGRNIRVGGGAKVSNLGLWDLLRIQNAANRSGETITVVGSRASGKARSNSDWDYVVDANSKTRNNLSRSLPGAGNISEGTRPNIDIFKGQVDESRPFIEIGPWQ
jgi:uncharacterized protein RhaS with RHS repeats